MHRRKGIFVSSDPHANVLLNLLIKRYGHLPGDYYIVEFDDSPISTEAVIPISAVRQNIDQIAHEAVKLLAEWQSR
nr:substrate-binding domain-containing protein [uncultured Blautia sp.]